MTSKGNRKCTRCGDLLKYVKNDGEFVCSNCGLSKEAQGYRQRGHVAPELIVMIGIFILAALACAPSRFVMRNDTGSPEAVCYEAGGGLFGGPALQCMPAHQAEATDGGAK
jgi:predicted RNA-binding Zn-ribbon protein involved in translation (DUF1610 family)